MKNQFEMVFAIVNSGYTEEVMEAVKACGATGGTIINARGTANTEVEKLFGIKVSDDIADAIMIGKYGVEQKKEKSIGKLF